MDIHFIQVETVQIKIAFNKLPVLLFIIYYLLFVICKCIKNRLYLAHNDYIQTSTDH